MTPGQLLSTAREAKGLSQADIAKQMRLSVEAVNDIEQDAYAKIGVRTFVRGYLSMYARIVDVSKTQLLELFDASALMPDAACSGHAILEGAPVMDVTRDGGKRMPYSKRTLAAVAGFLAIALLLLWFTNRGTEMKKDAVAMPAAAPTVSPAVAPTVATVATPPAQTPAVATVSSALPAEPLEAPKKPVLSKNAFAPKNQFVRKEKIHKHEKSLAPTYTITPVS